MKNWIKIRCIENKIMRKVILLSGLIISIFIFHSCHTAERARHYNYHFNKTDKLYIQSFKNNDSLSLTNIKDIQLALFLPDSLIVFEDTITTKKFYENYFEIYKEWLPDNFCIKKYSYDGKIISILYYSMYLQYEKINVEGKIYIRNFKRSTPRF